LKEGKVVVLIPYAMKCETTLRETLPKYVQCEQCQAEYVYLLRLTVQGHGTSLLFLDNEGARQRSAAQAEALLNQGLEEGCAVVPCPACGRIQEHMIPQARLLRHHWMRLAGRGFLFLAPLLALPAALHTLVDGLTWGVTSTIVLWWAFVALAAVGGLALLVVRGRLAAAYDPNTAPVEARKQQGQKLALSKEAFLRAVQAVQANEG
jgi:hypothetical protein